MTTRKWSRTLPVTEELAKTTAREPQVSQAQPSLLETSPSSDHHGRTDWQQYCKFRQRKVEWIHL